MPSGSYKNRTIYDQSGNVLDQNAKEANYQLSKNFSDGMIEQDRSLRKSLTYLAYLNFARTSYYNIDRPVAEWTDEEVLGKLREARTEAGLGRIGWFESSDRIRNFKARKALSDAMIEELNKVNGRRVISVVDASVGATASKRAVPQMNNEALNKIALNWIPYITRVRDENGPEYDDNMKALNPATVLRNLSEEDTFVETTMLNMLQVIEDTDMEEFAYTNDETFAANFGKKYEKLKALADGPELIDYIKARHDGRFETKRVSLHQGDDLSIKVAEAKSKMAKQLLRDYELRMRIITSPYYALFAGKDFEKLSDARIAAMKKGPGHEALDAYLEDVVKFKRNRQRSYKNVNIAQKQTAYVDGVRIAPPPDTRLESEKTLEQIDALIGVMASDTRNASAYRKVRTALRNYRAAANEADKSALLLEAVNASSLYLHERKTSSFGDRKTRCERLNSLYAKYQVALANEHQAVIDAERAAQQEALNRQQRRAELEAELAEKATTERNKVNPETVDNRLKQRMENAKKAEEERVRQEALRRERERIAAEERARQEAEAARLARDAEARRRKEEADRIASEKEAARQKVEFDTTVANAKSKAATFLTNYAQTQAIEEATKKEYLRYYLFTDAMDEAIDMYEALNEPGKGANDSKEVRKVVLKFFEKYVFIKKDDEKKDKKPVEKLETIPTAMLIAKLKEHRAEMTRENFEAGKCPEILENKLTQKSWSEEGTHEEMKKVLTDALAKKPEDIREKDRMDVYEYCVHVLDFVDVEDAYNSLENVMDLNSLANLTVKIIDFNYLRPDDFKDETFDDMTPEQREKHLEAAAEVISFFTGKDKKLYKYLSNEAIDDYVYDIMANLTEPKDRKEVLDECDKKARDIEERYELIKSGIESKDRYEIIQSLALVTATDQSDLNGASTGELLELANAVFANIKDEVKMLAAFTVTKPKMIGRGEEEYRKLFLDLETKRYEGKLTEIDALSRRDFAGLYIKEALNLQSVPLHLDELSDDDLYTLVSNIGVVKNLDGADNNKATNALLGLKLHKDLRDIVFQTLKDKMVFDKRPMFLDGKDVDIKYATEEALKYETLNVSHNLPDKSLRQTAEQSKELKKKTRAIYSKNVAKPPKDAKNQNIINEDVEAEINLNIINENVINDNQGGPIKEEEWHPNSKKTLSIIATCFEAVTKEPVDMNMIMDKFFYNSEVVAKLINDINFPSENSTWNILLEGLAPQEKIYVEAFKVIVEDMSKDVIKYMKPYWKDDKIHHINYKHLDKIIKDKAIKLDPEKLKNTLLGAMEKGEKNLVRIMREATAHPFDQIEGYGLPDIINGDGDPEKDKQALMYEQDSLRYNSEYGQGKFLASLMNNYYVESSLEDKGRMLSYIIKDFKKNDKRSVAEKGGSYFGSTLKGAGPLMQKMMQGIPEFMVVPELRTAVNSVKSSLDNIDKHEAQKIADKAAEMSDGKIEVISIQESLGAASVAETFTCFVKPVGKEPVEAVIKVRRPGVEKRLQSELPVVQKAAITADMTKEEEEVFKKNNPGKKIKPHDVKATEAGFLAQLSEINKEFDLENEAKNIEIGVKKYKEKDKNKTVHTVELVKDAPKGKDFLIMSKAEGVTLDRHIKETRDMTETALRPFEFKVSAHNTTLMATPENIGRYKNIYHKLYHQLKLSMVYGLNVSNVAYVWTEEALYGSAWSMSNDYNFRHGDLHSGNIMVTPEGATILDYGNASMLHHLKVTEILKMMCSVVLNKPEWFVEAFSKLIDMAAEEDLENGGKIGFKPIDEETKKEYIKKLSTIFATGNEEASGAKVLLSLTTAQSLGIKLPMELQNFSQCQQRLENSMAEIKEATLEVRKVMDKLERMPVSKELQDSCDPMAIFHRNMLLKNKSGKYVFPGTYEATVQLLTQFDPKETHDYLTDLIPITKAFNKKKKNVDEQLHNFKVKYFEKYNEVLGTTIGSEKVTMDTFPGKIDDFRKIYQQIKDEHKRTGNIPSKLYTQMAFMSGFFTVSPQTSGLFKQSTGEIGELNRKAFNPPFDDLAFEKLMVLAEAEIGMVQETSKMLDYGVKIAKLNKEQLKEYEDHNPDAMRTMRVTMLRKQPYIQAFVDQFKNPDLVPDFEKGMKRVFKENPEFEQLYTIYKKMKDDYEKLTLKNSHKEFVDTRKRLNRCEEMLIDGYANICKKTLTELRDISEDAMSSEILPRTIYIQDYMEVIGRVMKKWGGSTLHRLGTKYKTESDRQEKERERLEKERLEREKKEKEEKIKKEQEEKQRKEKEAAEKEKQRKLKAEKLAKQKKEQEKKKLEEAKKKGKGKPEPKMKKGK